MRVFWSVLELMLGTMLATTSAHACATLAEMDLRDIKYANVVVVGQIANYEIVLDPVIRQRYRDMIAGNPKLRETLGNPKSFTTDYARFDIRVGEVLHGKAPERLTVSWDNSTFSEPANIGPGPFLVALRDPNSPVPPLRGPSATVMPNPAPAALTVLQAPCAGPFMFEASSKEAGLVRRMLSEQAE